MKNVIIKCGKGKVEKTLACIEKKDSGVRWASGDKLTGFGGAYEEEGLYLVIERDTLTFIEVDEFEYADRKGKTVVSAKKYIGKNPGIVIFRRDRNVIAKDVATGNEGIAKCSPDDEFCFKTGASIALARLMAKTPEVLTDDVKAEWKKVLGIKDSEKKVYTDADRNFKVGDRVVVRDWDDMAKEYGVYDGGGTIKCPNGFTVTMKHLCGRTATVVDVNGTSISVDFDDKSGDTYWSYVTHMFNPTDANKSDDGKIHEGDKVRIKKGCTGMRYGLYHDWVKEYISDPDLLIAFECENHINTSLDYEVVKIAPHGVQSKTLAYIKCEGAFRTICYLFNVEALEKV